MPRKRIRTERQAPLQEAIAETRKRIAAQFGSNHKDWDPLIELSLIAADRTVPRRERVAVLMEVTEYWYPKQKAVEIDVNLGGQTGVLRVPGVDPDAWTQAATVHREQVLDGEFSVEDQGAA